MEAIKLSIYASNPIESLIEALAPICDVLYVTRIESHLDAGVGTLTEAMTRVDTFVTPVSLMLALTALQEWLQTGDHTTALVEISRSTIRPFDRFD